VLITGLNFKKRFRNLAEFFPSGKSEAGNSRKKGRGFSEKVVETIRLTSRA